MAYALDSNVIIDYLNKNASVMAKFRDVAKSKTLMIIPAVVNYEIMRGFYHTKNTDKEVNYTKIRQHCPVDEVDSAIWDCAALLWSNLRKARRNIGDADILIAAHCIINGYTLATHNTKHFQCINNLIVEDWT